MSATFAEIDPGQTYTEDDFIHGQPEAIFQAKDPEILVVWPHGDETLGPKVGYHMYNQRQDLLESVDYICGNPQAASQRPTVRDTGADLNRSYGPGTPPGTYEYERAQHIKRLVEDRNYKFILDLHTTVAEQDDCLILKGGFLDQRPLQQIIAASPVKHIVVFPSHIAEQGLIGHYPNSLSFEYSRSFAETRGVPDVITTIDGLLQGEPLCQPFERELYHVDAIIAKDKDPGSDAKNFEWCDAEYFPVLFGEDTYRNDPTKHYLGFQAASREFIIM